MKKVLFLIAFLFILSLLSACNKGGNVDPLGGTNWQLVSMGDQLPLTGSTVTITFAEGRAGGSAGCNSYGGTYTVNDGGFVMQEISTTLMACLDAGMMEQEQAYLAFLGELTSYSVSEGVLYLYRPDGSALKFMLQQ